MTSGIKKRVDPRAFTKRLAACELTSTKVLFQLLEDKCEKVRMIAQKNLISRGLSTKLGG